MTTRVKIEALGGFILFALICLLGYEQYRKAIDNAKAEVRAEADQQAQAKLADQIKALDTQKQKLDAKQEAQDAALAKMSVPQIIERAPIYIPQASKPIVVVGPDTVPAKVGDVIVPQEDVKPIAEKILEGKQCSEQLAIEAQKSTALGDELKLATDQAEQWKRAAKGGSIWKRAGKTVVILGIGAAVGYAAHR